MAASRRTWCDEGRTHFEYIVVGCGGIGSAAVYWLAKRAKADVLGIEQFELGHHNGGSQDHSRIIRLTYHDDRYTKIARETFQTWHEVEKESGVQLVYKSGGLNMSRRGEADLIMENYAKAMDDQNIKYERLDSEALMKKFPQFEVDKDVISLYQPDAGLVDAALANSVHLQLARGYGASILANAPVIRVLRNDTGQISVQTTKGTFTCRRLVVAAGAWINQVLGSVGVHIPVTVTQEQVTYMGTPYIKEFTKDKFPIFVYHTPGHDFYQIPVHGNAATKVGADACGEVVTACTRTFTPNAELEKQSIDFMASIAPKFIGPVVQTKTCLYTMTPDRHYVIDKCDHVGFSDIVFCCGAGHAYKFACLIGKILSEMAIDGQTQYDISGFTKNREAITNPNFKPLFQMAGDSANKAKL
ncbi:monomeric sarcosine oxidase-like isoform X2 [Patella vulgata]|uniref:monomeric sarcosine oxidase-like isoform X2 n=1 Tax=Patella vulgata TaxID=6465 RepID=UPI0024A8BE93|nr:monomeric sarcosine oxidase-like isoform X2 [Patella vulgata]